jgi:hypothetical protein
MKVGYVECIPRVISSFPSVQINDKSRINISDYIMETLRRKMGRKAFTC